MPTITVAGSEVDVNDEGFFTDPSQWTEEMAPELAAADRADDAGHSPRTARGLSSSFLG